MAKHKPILLAAALLGLITACERPVPPAPAEGEASYSVGTYLQQQIAKLQATKPMVLKSVNTEDRPTETIQTADLDWEKELSVFQEVDLNRPALHEYYQVQRSTHDDGSTITQYKKDEGAEAPVDYLLLHTAPDQRFQQLEAVILEKNIIFYSRRKISLRADQNGDIAGYRVEGVQQLIFGDSLHYRIDANL